MRILALGAIAACAVACAAASGAYAEALPAPYWAACANASPKNTGDYKNKSCSEASEPGKGGYELKESIGKGKAFKSATLKGKLVALHVKFWEGDDRIECQAAKGSGKPALPDLEREVSITYTGCLAFETQPCASSGAKKPKSTGGEIKISGLEGELGYVSEEPVSVGLKLENEKEPGKVMAEFSCYVEETNSETHKKELVPDIEAKLTGAVIGVQTGDVDTVSKESKLEDQATERYGTHYYPKKPEKPYKPLVNILGWANEVAGILKAEEEEKEEEDPAHVIKGEFCGSFIEKLLQQPCTPPTYTGIDQELINKGEALMIKT
jgi:hypothetical protein